MNKKRLHHIWRQLRPISYWYFFAAFVISSLIAVYALRQNNLTAIALRDEVLKVDQEDGDVEAALRSLREHVYAHMNASLSSETGLQQPIQLKYRYERLIEAEKQRVATANEKVYTDAQRHCEALHPASLSGGPRIPCIEEYVNQNGAHEQAIPDAMYKFDFLSPRWSPDLAGWSLVASAVFLSLFVIRFLLERWMKAELS